MPASDVGAGSHVDALHASQGQQAAVPRCHWFVLCSLLQPSQKCSAWPQQGTILFCWQRLSCPREHSAHGYRNTCWHAQCSPPQHTTQRQWRSGTQCQPSEIPGGSNTHRCRTPQRQHTTQDSCCRDPSLAAVLF